MSTYSLLIELSVRAAVGGVAKAKVGQRLKNHQYFLSLSYYCRWGDIDMLDCMLLLPGTGHKNWNGNFIKFVFACWISQKEEGQEEGEMEDDSLAVCEFVMIWLTLFQANWQTNWYGNNYLVKRLVDVSRVRKQIPLPPLCTLHMTNSIKPVTLSLKPKFAHKSTN